MRFLCIVRVTFLLRHFSRIYSYSVWCFCVDYMSVWFSHVTPTTSAGFTSATLSFNRKKNHLKCITIQPYRKPFQGYLFNFYSRYFLFHIIWNLQLFTISVRGTSPGMSHPPSIMYHRLPRDGIRRLGRDGRLFLSASHTPLIISIRQPMWHNGTGLIIAYRIISVVHTLRFNKI